MMTAILFALLAGLAVGALLYALLQPRIAMEKNAKSRLTQMKGAETDAVSKRAARDRVAEVAKRRRNLQASLKAVDDKQKAHSKATNKASVEKQIAQAGLSLSMTGFVLLSIAAGFLSFLLALVFGLSLLVALGVGIVGGYGLPRLVLSRLRRRRQLAFIEEFANAVDLIVRGIKSGLPLNDTMRMIASEAKEPVRSEFKRVVEAQQMGLSTAEAVDRLYQNMPLSETNFFSIVISIQAQAGGNLSEALGNLSRVLRERKKMKMKIQAMSMEAKASGGIIGALPVVVAVLVWLTTPDYIAVLFTSLTGQMILAASAFWMAVGVFVMKRMIAFDF
jgi:tight adherence protein B